MQAASCRSITQHVANSAYGVNQRRLEPFVDLIAQRVDMDIDDIADAVEVDIPDVLDNHRSRHRTVCITQKKLEQRIFLQFQVDGLAGPADLPRGCIHFEIRDAQAWILLASTPKQRTNPRRQFDESKWLDQIVIG